MEIETYTGSAEPTSSAYFARARSVDGMFSYHHAMPGYVCVDCAMSGLDDNTHGQVGKHVLYLQHPGSTPTSIVAGAREFSEAVSTDMPVPKRPGRPRTKRPGPGCPATRVLEREVGQDPHYGSLRQTYGESFRSSVLGRYMGASSGGLLG